MIYCKSAHRFADGRSPEELLAYFEEENVQKGLILFAEEPLVLGLSKDHKSVFYSPADHFSGMHFARQLQTGLMKQTFLGKECQIVDIYLIYDDYFGTIVIFKTDKGDFVRFYDDITHAPEPMEFSWEEYTEYAHAYTECEKEMLKHTPYRGPGSFPEFVEEYKAEKEAARQAELEAARQRTIWIAVSVGAVVVLAAGAAILVYTQKRKHHPAQT
jgi:hypothetical protein